MRRPLVIYDFAPNPFEFPYMRKILFSFLSVCDVAFSSNVPGYIDNDPKSNSDNSIFQNVLFEALTETK
jgi:hypothetical protein